MHFTSLPSTSLFCTHCERFGRVEERRFRANFRLVGGGRWSDLRRLACALVQMNPPYQLRQSWSCPVLCSTLQTPMVRESRPTLYGSLYPRHACAGFLEDMLALAVISSLATATKKKQTGCMHRETYLISKADRLFTLDRPVSQSIRFRCSNVHDRGRLDAFAHTCLDSSTPIVYLTSDWVPGFNGR